ncbi:RAD52 motif-containing protein 1-like [Pocillopora damicornis]|nr:RAD52 motif-containing protein 1-like [Pocillopora damicornis]
MAKSKDNIEESKFLNSPKVELIEFFRPYKNEVNLYVTNLSRRLEKEMVQVKLLEIFSQFGLIYEVQVMDSSDNSEASEEINSNCASSYAFVKFYSAREARRAKESTHGKWILGGQFLKLDKLENRSETEDSQEKTNAVYRCVVRLEIKDCEFFCEGTGYGGDKNILEQERDPTKKMELLGYAKKLAHRHAYENAFKRVIIISLDNGKVGVEINMQDIPECSLDESGEEGIVQINYLEEMLFSDSEDEKNSEIEFQDTSNTLLDTHVIDVSS